MTTPDDRPGILDRLNTWLEAREHALKAPRTGLDAAKYLRRQDRSRAQLAKAVTAWAELTRTDRTHAGPMPVTTVEARNAAGEPITVTVLVTITPGAKP